MEPRWARPVTVIVTVTASLPPLPSVTRTVTEYLDFSSWFSSATVRIWPPSPVDTISNAPASGPSRLYRSGSPSWSVAVIRAPTSVFAGVFSATLSERDPPEKAGFLFAVSRFGAPDPGVDQRPVPSALCAATRTT